jgi:hypothetical protein
MPLVAVRDAACLYQVPDATIRSWISRDDIPGQPDPALIGRPGQRKLYPLEQLQDAYDRRHRTRC